MVQLARREAQIARIGRDAGAFSSARLQPSIRIVFCIPVPPGVSSLLVARPPAPQSRSFAAALSGPAAGSVEILNARRGFI